MLQLQDVTKAFGEKTLLEHVTWQVGDRDRVGLCGPNGAGKTTLLKMLAGLDEPDSGIIQKPNALTLGYLPQDGLSHTGRTVVAEASLALKPLLDLKAEMHDLEARLGDAALSEAEHDAMLARYSEVQDRFRLSDGYQIELKVATVLRGLGFEPEAQQQLTDHLSGGWQMRLALAKLLLLEPDLLLLDEPTNHLDLDARNWLEEYLVAYPHSVILVSHDRYFLDAVVTHIADLTLRKITEYHTNYTKYLEQRDAAIERLREAKRRQDEEIQRVEEFINRFRYQATKAAQVQSRIKMLDKVERLEVPPERKRIHFQFPAAPKSGRMVLELKDARKAYRSARSGQKIVLDRVNLHIERGDRIALVGHNGAGKSTLMRMLSGEEAARLGHAHRRPPGRDAVLRAGRSDAARAGADGLRNALGRIAAHDGAGHPQHPRRLPVLRRRRLQEGRRAVGRRTHAPRRRAHAAAAVEHAAARRADQSPRHRLEGSAARRARRLRRHADLRLARSLLRREARHEDHRGRRRQGHALPGRPTRAFLWSKATTRGAVRADRCQARDRSKAGCARPKHRSQPPTPPSR